MAQHDNGRRAGGTQSGAWQQDHRDQHDYSSNQQDQSSGGRYGSQQGGGQQGSHDQGNARGHQDQYDSQRGQQGDNWRGSASERDRGWDANRGGQGSFGGQASDNDYGNRGITESGNFGNYGGQRDSGDHGALTGQNRYGQGAPTWGQSSADNYQGSRGSQEAPGNRDRYGDNGYQGNWQQGRNHQGYHDPDYHQWRTEQISRLDREYDEWRQHRYQRFSEDFDNWRSNRDNNPAARASSQVGQPSAAGAGSGQQAGSSTHDVSQGGEKGAGKTASK